MKIKVKDLEHKYNKEQKLLKIEMKRSDDALAKAEEWCDKYNNILEQAEEAKKEIDIEIKSAQKECKLGIWGLHKSKEILDKIGAE